MIWVLVVVGSSLLLSVLFTWVADRALREPEKPPAPPCEHPWYIDHRCIVCGQPK